MTNKISFYESILQPVQLQYSVNQYIGRPQMIDGGEKLSA